MSYSLDGLYIHLSYKLILVDELPIYAYKLWKIRNKFTFNTIRHIYNLNMHQKYLS